MYGWTIMCKWGHPVATLPVTNGIVRHNRRVTKILRITVHSLQYRVKQRKRDAPAMPCFILGCQERFIFQTIYSCDQQQLSDCMLMTGDEYLRPSFHVWLQLILR
eukprot:1739734-Pleurochrysis_carterae.AAC.1